MSDWELGSPTSREPTGAAPGASSPRPGDSTFTPPSDAATPPTGRRKATSGRRYLVVAGGLVILVVGLLSGFYIARSYSSAEAAELREIKVELSELKKGQAHSELRNWDYYRLVQALTAENEALKNGHVGIPSSTDKAATGAESYGDGLYVVGEDLLPGVYEGVVTGKVGYWARLRGTDGSVGSILENEVVQGPFVLTVNEADMAIELWGVEITPR